MDENQSTLFSNCQFRDPVTEEAVAELETRLNQKLPDEYLRIMAFSDGFEGPLGDGPASVSVWPVEEVFLKNTELGVSKLAPGILVIGVTGTGEGICMDMRDSSQSFGCFFMVPLDPFDWDDAESLGCIVEEAFEKLKNPFNLPPEGGQGNGTKPLSEQG